jgi:dsRNA-specific ribonuclease
MKGPDRRKKLLEEAWIGDAVLTLYARERILEREGKVDQGQAERMTANRFLQRFGEASAVEAEIGRVYKEKGLEAAFAYVERHLEPSFLQSERNRLGSAKRKTAG